MYRDLQIDDAALATCVQSPLAKTGGLFPKFIAELRLQD